jgi:hypothetical protein
MRYVHEKGEYVMTSTPKKAAKKADWESAREESGELSMKANQNPSPKGKSPSQQIDAIIRESGDWRGKKLSQLRCAGYLEYLFEIWRVFLSKHMS